MTLSLHIPAEVSNPEYTELSSAGEVEEEGSGKNLAPWWHIFGLSGQRPGSKVCPVLREPPLLAEGALIDTL